MTFSLSVHVMIMHGDVMSDGIKRRLKRMSDDIALLEREAKTTGLITLAFLLDMARLEADLRRGIIRVTRQGTIVST